MSEMIQVPEGWDVIQLGKIGSFKNGVNKSKDDFGFGVPFINLQDVFGHWEIEHSDFDLVNVTEEELKNYNLKKGDILFIRSSVKLSGVGLTSVIKEDILNTIYSGFIIRFRSKDKIFDIEYTKYCFHDEFFRQRLLQKSTVSANSNINQESLVTLDILLPPIKEQEKIAKILSILDKAIESTNLLIEKEKNIKTALVQELLTNGIDEKGKIRTSQTHKYKQSKLGLIPYEWDFDMIENHTKIITGDKDTQDRSYDGIYPFYVRSQTIEKINTYSFDGEAVLTAGDGVGVGKVFHFVNERFDFHQRVYCIYGFSEKLNSAFFFEYFRTYFIEQVNKYSAKGSVDSVRYDMIALMNIPLPPINEQKQIAKILTTQDKKTEIEEINLAKLKELKKGLMNDLLTGKARIKV